MCFFASVFTSDDINCDINMDKLKENATELNSKDITSAKVKDKLDKLKPFSAPGPDGLSPFILKELSTEICFPLSVIFQRSLNEGLVPSDWKLANVTPIFKNGSKFEPGNYRPVSLTSILCKVMESILRDDMVEHLKDNELIFSSQHGFVNRRSCLTNLLEYFEKVTELIDQGNSVDIFYLDFAKAFDKVANRKLEVLLEKHCISGHIKGWIKEWLSDRQQRVVLNRELL